MPESPLASAADVQHGDRAYREMTFYLPTEVARELSLFCMDRNCDANHVVAGAVKRHVADQAALPPDPPVAKGGWGGRLESVVGQLRARLDALRPSAR